MSDRSYPNGAPTGKIYYSENIKIHNNKKRL